MREPELVFFRFDMVKETKVIDITKCKAVGFLNIGPNPCFLNRLMPIPTQNPNNSYNVVWFPILENERDATRYEIFFSVVPPRTKAGNNCLVIYKEYYNPQSNG